MRLRWRAAEAVVGLVLTAGCAGGGAASRAPAPPTPVDQAAPLPASPDERLRGLAAKVDALQRAPQRSSPALISAAVGALADATKVLVPAAATAAAQLGLGARELGLSPDAPPAVVERGLFALHEALVHTPAPAGDPAAYEESLRALSRAHDALTRKGAPRERQLAALVSASRAATDALYLLRGAEPPFREEGPPVALELPLPEALEQARVEVLALARAEWTDTREPASRALAALASVVAAVDQRGTQEARVAQLRSTARRLHFATAVTFGQAQWVKAALSISLDALDALGLGRGPWARTARDAVASIDEQAALGFQRAPVQDAYRATLEAFAAGVRARAPQSALPGKGSGLSCARAPPRPATSAPACAAPAPARAAPRRTRRSG